MRFHFICLDAVFGNRSSKKKNSVRMGLHVAGPSCGHLVCSMLIFCCDGLSAYKTDRNSRIQCSYYCDLCCNWYGHGSCQPFCSYRFRLHAQFDVDACSSRGATITSKQLVASFYRAAVTSFGSYLSVFRWCQFRQLSSTVDSRHSNSERSANTGNDQGIHQPPGAVKYRLRYTMC